MSIRIANEKDLPELVALYRKCFAEAPWFEVHDPEEVLHMFQKYMNAKSSLEMVVYVCEQDGHLVGGAIGFDIWYKQEVLELIYDYCAIYRNAWVDLKSYEPREEIRKVFYFAELFVDSAVRGQGIGKALIEKRLTFARAHGYEKGVVRTSIEQTIIRHLYMDQMGFKELSRQALLAKKLIDSVEQELAYTSVIMAGNI